MNQAELNAELKTSIRAGNYSCCNAFAMPCYHFIKHSLLFNFLHLTLTFCIHLTLHFFSLQPIQRFVRSISIISTIAASTDITSATLVEIILFVLSSLSNIYHILDHDFFFKFICLSLTFQIHLTLHLFSL